MAGPLDTAAMTYSQASKAYYANDAEALAALQSVFDSLQTLSWKAPFPVNVVAAVSSSVLSKTTGMVRGFLRRSGLSATKYLPKEAADKVVKGMKSAWLTYAQEAFLDKLYQEAKKNDVLSFALDKAGAKSGKITRLAERLRTNAKAAGASPFEADMLYYAVAKDSGLAQTYLDKFVKGNMDPANEAEVKNPELIWARKQAAKIQAIAKGSIPPGGVGATGGAGAALPLALGLGALALLSR